LHNVAGGNPNAFNRDGAAPLHVAAKQGDLKIVKVLVCPSRMLLLTLWYHKISPVLVGSLLKMHKTRHGGCEDCAFLLGV
jgi:ankyrin repeat protein